MPSDCQWNTCKQKKSTDDNVNDFTTYNRPQRESDNLGEFKPHVEGANLGRYAWRLLERTDWVAGFPKFIINLERKIQIEAMSDPFLACMIPKELLPTLLLLLHTAYRD